MDLLSLRRTERQKSDIGLGMLRLRMTKREEKEGEKNMEKVSICKRKEEEAVWRAMNRREKEREVVHV